MRADDSDIRSRAWAARCVALSLAGRSAASTLEEVIVTATRSPVALASYAGSATRIDAGATALVGATHSSELVNRAAGAMIQRGSGEESLTALRSPVLTGAGACGSVLVLEDGIPIRPVGSCNVNELFEVNLDQAAAIEVLRGPGSVLYGSSAVHGIINVIPPMPDEIPALRRDGRGRQRRLAPAGPRGLAPTRADGGFGVVMQGTDDGGWRDASGFEEEKLNAVWTRALASGRLKLALSGSNLDQETAGFIVGEDAYRDPRSRARTRIPRRTGTRTASASRRSTSGESRQAPRGSTTAARAWISSSTSCSASRSRRTARTAAASCSRSARHRSPAAT